MNAKKIVIFILLQLSAFGLFASLSAYALTPILTSIAVTPVNSTIKVGETLQYTPIGTFSTGTSRELIGGVGTWVGKAPMLRTRYEIGVGVVNGILYAMGGDNINAMEAYDPATNTWTPKAPMYPHRLGLGVGVVNGILYAVGGADYLGYATRTVEAYDPVTNTWTRKADLPVEVTGLGVGVVNGILYAVGGGINRNSISNNLQAYDPATDTWTIKAPLPIPRIGTAVGVVNGILYAVGGYSNGYFLASVEAYDPVTNTWTTKASMPTARSYLAVGVENGILYAVGGRYSNGPATYTYATVEAYNPATDTWTTSPSMPTPRSALAVGVENGKLYAVGGLNGNLTLATVEAFTPPDQFVWSSNTTSVATIIQSGVAAGISVGQTSITATSGNISGSTSLMVTRPDLIVTAVSGSATSAVRGKSFTINSTTKNQGNGATTVPTSTGLYLSKDSIITTADTRVGTVSVGILAPGASLPASTAVTFGKTFTTGFYYLGAIADYTNAEVESNTSGTGETNNALTGSLIQLK